MVRTTCIILREADEFGRVSSDFFRVGMEEPYRPTGKCYRVMSVLVLHAREAMLDGSCGLGGVSRVLAAL